jgi:antitoxin (DNA-binding transcriptional repressor) of toxin-antitoxin stability system
MSKKLIDVSEAQSHLIELIDQAADGTEIILTEGERPRARLLAIPVHGAPRVPGLHLGSISTSDDFDAPLPEEFWTGAS